MSVEQLTWILGGVVAVAWWLFKEKITSLKTDITSLKADFEAALNSLRSKCEGQQVQIQYLLVEIEKRVRREELESLRHEIKNDFRDFKDELISALKSNDNNKST